MCLAGLIFQRFCRLLHSHRVQLLDQVIEVVEGLTEDLEEIEVEEAEDMEEGTGEVATTLLCKIRVARALARQKAGNNILNK